MAEDALQWAKSRAASLAIEDLPARIGGELIPIGTETHSDFHILTGIFTFLELQ